MKPQLTSALSRALKRGLSAALSLSAFMLANSLYLIFGRMAERFNWFSSPIPLPFQAMVLVHTVAGLSLVLLMVGFLVGHLPRVWNRYHTSSAISGIGFVLIGLLLAITGMFILTEAASRNNEWVWWLHVAAAVSAPTGYAIHRLVSRVQPRKGRLARFASVTMAITVCLIVVHLGTAQGTSSGTTGNTEGQDRASSTAFQPVAFVPVENRFFPSAAVSTTHEIPPSAILGTNPIDSAGVHQETVRDGFASTTSIGAQDCVRCHQDVVAQWEASAHRFSSFNNPFYEAAINLLLDPAVPGNNATDEYARLHPEQQPLPGPIRAQFCAACHDPALLFSGQILAGPTRTSVEAQAGLTCQACHSISRIAGRTGNGNYVFEARSDPYLFPDAPRGSFSRFLHDAAMRAKPEVHRRQMMTEEFNEPQFCSACHKVSLSSPINDYRWLRGQDEFDSWDDSGVSLNAARTFYLPASKKVCQDCHMPAESAPLGDLAAENGTVRSHRFTAANTALPFLRGDTATIRRIENFLGSEKLSVTIFALTDGSDREATMNFRSTGTTIPASKTVTVDVVVRNRGVGHGFPGGTNDSNEGWLEFTILDPTGRIIFQSGQILPDGHLDPTAHAFKSVVLDSNGEAVLKRNAQAQRAVAFSNVISPGTADVAHYEFRLPEEFIGQFITIRARLLWRKFNRSYMEFAYQTNPAGFVGFDTIPDLPVTEIDSDEIVIQVGGEVVTATDAELGDSASWTDFNDYGIGLLLEGNTRGAARAFRKVVELRPDNFEGDLNLARTALADGNISQAYEHLRRAEEITPGNARVAWVWANATQEDGRYEQAVVAYRRVLDSFPGDRRAWRNLGRTLYLDGRYEEAIEAFDAVLAIDPEDRISHYHQMLSFRALGELERASLSQQAYEYYQVDESAAAITRRFLRENPGANLMSQQIRTHRMAPIQRD